MTQNIALDNRSQTPAPPRRHKRVAAMAILIVFAVHAGMLIRGATARFPATSPAYYDLLADAFAHGQTYLLLKPPAALLKLPDPYDARANLHYRLHDAVLFHDRYYLYWGPVPALLITPAELLGAGRIPDWALVFVFVEGAMLAAMLLLLAVGRHWFPTAPAWPMAMALLVMGLGTPFLFLFTRPSVYEAAIAGGQCFLLFGAWLAVTALVRSRNGTISRWRLLAAGACGALAMGSRLSLAPLVAMLAGIVLWEIRRKTGRAWKALIGDAALLILPLVLMASSLAYYNYARFGSAREPGVRYMLASGGARRALSANQTFSTRYIAANAANYLFAPFGPKRQAPFVRPLRGLPAPRPHYFSTDLVAGIIVILPILLLALIPVTGAAAKLARRWQTDRAITLALWLIAFAAAMMPLLEFFYCSMRYLSDLLPGLAIASAIGVWQIDRRINSSRGTRGLIILLATYSCLIGVLLAFVGYGK